MGAKGGMAGFMAALVAALWAYDGWNDLNMVSGEIQRPERSIPIALIAGVFIVGCALHGSERRRAIRDAFQRDRCFTGTRVSGHADCHWTLRRPACLRRNGHLNVCHV